MFKLSTILLAATVSLTGCMGYSSLYKQTSEDIGNVYVGNVSVVSLGIKAGERRVAQLVHQRLRYSFHAAEESQYVLSAKIREDNVTLAVRRDATDQRLQLNLSAEVMLHDAEGKEVFKTTIGASAPYNVEDSPFGTDAGREQARTSAARTLGDEVTYRVIRFLHSSKQSK